jgi:hypothetical protein
MKFILLALAINPPAYMGTYDTQKSCENAIRSIYATPLIVPNLTYSQQQLDTINRVIDTQLQYQHNTVVLQNNNTIIW